MCPVIPPMGPQPEPEPAHPPALRSGGRRSACRSGDARHPGRWSGGGCRMVGCDGGRGCCRRRSGWRHGRLDWSADFSRCNQRTCKFLRRSSSSRGFACDCSRRRRAFRSCRGDHAATWPRRPDDARESLSGRRLERIRREVGAVHAGRCSTRAGTPVDAPLGLTAEMPGGADAFSGFRF
jgi:hypothetical protein